MAVLLHAMLFSSLIVVIDFSERSRPVVPLAIKGTLVTEVPVAAPPKVEERQPPPPPEPTVSEQERIEAERQKLLEEQRAEEQRLHRLAEEKRKADEEAERKRKEDEERRRKEAEAEMERKRLEAERKRQEDIERQRRENEAARQAELEADMQRVEAMTANAKAAYMFAIRQRVMNRWVRPPTATVGVECIAHITQVPGGEVISVRIGRCNGDATVRRSIENAIHLASPLPVPEDPSVFSREITLEFRPRED